MVERMINVTGRENLKRWFQNMPGYFKRILPGALFVWLMLFSSCTDYSSTTAPQKTDPSVMVYYPAQASGTNSYARVILFKWRAVSEENEPARVRYLFTPVVDTSGTYNPGFDILDDLNRNPWRYQDRWSSWIPYHAPGDSGRSTIIGDDEEVELLKYHIFAVQARGEENTITREFREGFNARKFIVAQPSGPELIMMDPGLAGFKFLGEGLSPAEVEIPPGYPLNFRWQADASSYGGGIRGFRYGWDITGLESWEAPFSGEAESIPETAFYSGVHTLTVEVSDLQGNITRGIIHFTVVPFPMTRNLLWVDDFYSVSFPIEDYSHPPEYRHDQFWLDICSRALGFDPSLDVFDCDEHRAPPDLRTMGNYKNIIWTYSSSCDYWSELVHFIPGDKISQQSPGTINYLPSYLTMGGHLWTLGRSERRGGLASVIDPGNMIFPFNLECEINGINPDGRCDRGGVKSMAYRDYCVTVIDKVKGRFRPDDMPERRLDHYDVMEYAYRDNSLPRNSSCPGMPRRLKLWSEVTAPGRFFDPDSSSSPGGFTYVELYDPEYWMQRKGLISQACFTPLYRMKAKNDTSAVDHSTAAIWLTRYDHVVPSVASGPAVAAPSFHFGFPLWFFNRSEVDSLADAIFGRWQISDPALIGQTSRRQYE